MLFATNRVSGGGAECSHAKQSLIRKVCRKIAETGDFYRFSAVFLLFLRGNRNIFLKLI